MRYLDTSVLLAFLLPEAGSGAAEALMTSDGDPLVISSWSEVELMSAHRATIFTFDQGMAKAGATLGIAVRLLKVI